MKRLLYASTVLAACSRKDLPSCGGGYAVVDPMPAPAGCAGIAMRSVVTAKWKEASATGATTTGDGGAANASSDAGASARVIVVELSVPSDAQADFDAASKYGGGVLKPTKRDGLVVVYEIELHDETTTWTAFDVPVHCPPDGSPSFGNGRLTVSISMDRPGGKITASLQDT
jgi:hypothetical protein